MVFLYIFNQLKVKVEDKKYIYLYIYLEFVEQSLKEKFKRLLQIL